MVVIAITVCYVEAISIDELENKVKERLHELQLDHEVKGVNTSATFTNYGTREYLAQITYVK